MQLPDMPARIAKLPRDARGYPVPVFVQWMRDGSPAARGALGAEPDFRIADAVFRQQAFKGGFCWVCGERLGVDRIYAIGPMCVINRVTSEPACHLDCAEWSARACPFLSRPRMRRNEKDLPEGWGQPGVGLLRNPGCVCLYKTNEAWAFNDGGGSWLIRLGEPERVEWYAEGRKATRVEILASIDSGYPLLLKEAQKDGPDAVIALAKMAAAATRFLPEA